MLRALHLLGTRTAFVVCVLLALAAGLSAGRSLWFSLTGKIAEGLVTRQLEELTVDWSAPATALPNAPIQTANATRLYRAVVAFVVDGKQFEVRAKMRSTARLYPTGTKVDVVFPPGQPGRAQLRPELADFWTQASTLLMAVIMGAGTSYLWWKESRRRARRKRHERAQRIASEAR
jgi:hypothetical protein